MTINVPQKAYSTSSGTTTVNGYKLINRDPGTADVAYPLKQLWINSDTNANWQLVDFTASSGVVSAIWRAIPPIVLSTSAPATSDYQYPLGQIWGNTSTSLWYLLTAVSGTTATWENFAGSGLSSDSFTPDTGTSPVVPDATGLVGMRGQVTPNTSGIQVTGGTNVLNIAMFSPFVGDFSFLRNTGGATEKLLVSNTVDAASSAAQIIASVAGGSSGDPQSIWSTTATDWSAGIDNSDSDKWKISQGTALGTNDVMEITTTGRISLPQSTSYLWVGTTSATIATADIVAEKAVSGGAVEIECRNTSNTASSDAVMGVVVAQSAAGDPYFTYNVGGVQSWSTGIDNSDSDKWKLSASNTLGTSDKISVTTAGAITFNNVYTFPTTDGTSGQQLTTDGAGTVTWSNPTTSQLLVYAHLAADLANQTGDNTNATVIFDTATVNVGSPAPYDTGTGIFTTPATGNYSFQSSVFIENIDVAHTLSSVFVLNGANITIQSGILSPSACRSSGNYMSLNISGTIALTAGDLIKLQVNIQGGGKTIGFGGSASQFYTYMCITRVS